MEKKTNGILIAILVLLVILLLGGIFYIIYDQGLITNNNNNNEENNIVEQDKNVIVEKDVNNTDEKNALNDLVKNIDVECLMNGVKLYDNLNLTNKEKLQIALNSIYSKNTNVVEITEDEVESEYYNIFNENLQNHESVEPCPAFDYDKNSKMYKLGLGCGKGNPGPEQTISYINKYTSKNNEYYVYINLGATRFDNYDQNNDAIVNVYTDKNATKLYKTEKYGADLINQSNYTNFSEYKYTFVKRENGTFYFKSIEKTRD